VGQGLCLDNAVCKGFFATLRRELARRRSWACRPEFQRVIVAWIERWYNPLGTGDATQPPKRDLIVDTCPLYPA
jgi:transposase InsO family protein